MSLNLLPLHGKDEILTSITLFLSLADGSGYLGHTIPLTIVSHSWLLSILLYVRDCLAILEKSSGNSLSDIAR
jgi:hypothetical protein